jgi:prophage regulatory protein
MNIAANDNRIIVSINDVCQMTSLSRTAISKFRSTRKFPAEVSLGERRIGFVHTEVRDWIEQRISARSAAA